MSTDQGERAEWAPAGDELAPDDSDEPDKHSPPTQLSRQAGGPRDQAVEWMRWMGFTGAENVPVGLSLVLFDGKGEQRAAADHTTELFDHAPVRAGDQAIVPVPVDEPRPSGPGPFLHPTLVADDRAVALVRKYTQGHLSNREVLAWVRQSWVPVYRIRTDFTSKSGLGSELRFASTHQLFDSISGRPVTFKRPPTVPALSLAGPAALAVRSRIPVDDIMDETVGVWNEYCGLNDKAALKRHAAVLAGRGVPASVAHTINLELDSLILFPVFVGLLTHSTGDRLVAVDGVTGQCQAAMSSAMTLSLRSVREELERNRSVPLTPALPGR
jgi:hypothetical protein